MINKIAKWREKNKKFFFFQKKFTFKDLEFYLETFSIKKKDRILFLVYDKTNKLVGHIGISNLKQHHCYLDNMIRGEDTKEKYLMLAAEETILLWALNSLKCKKIFGVLWEKNILMLKYHTKYGFKIYKKVYEFNQTLNLKMRKIYIVLLKKNFSIICNN